MRLRKESLRICVISRDWPFLQMVKRALRCQKYLHVGTVMSRSYLAAKSPVFIVDKNCPEALLAHTLVTLEEGSSLERSLMIGDLNVAQICEFLSMGIRGFLSERAIDTKLHQAIISVCSGRLVVSRDALEHYVAYSQSRLRSRLNQRRPLTHRQHELVQFLEHGSTNKEISSPLHISENTVKFHMAKLFSKLGVHDRRAIQDVTGHPHLEANCDAPSAANLDGAIAKLPECRKSESH